MNLITICTVIVSTWLNEFNSYVDNHAQKFHQNDGRYNIIDTTKTTITYEEYASSIFDEWINNFKGKIYESKKFSKREINIIKKTKTKLNNNSLSDIGAFSNSKTKDIKISRGLLNWIVRSSVCQMIDLSPRFNRRFMPFYLNTYPKIIELYPSFAVKSLPEDVAHLSKNEKDALFSKCDTNEFGWLIKSRILFIYLHEIGHQLHDYTKESDKIYSKYGQDKIRRDSALLQLEMNADMYAINSMIKIGVDPLEIENVHSFLIMTREKKSPIEVEQIVRSYNYYNYCLSKLKKIPENIETRIYIEKRQKDLLTLLKYYSINNDRIETGIHSNNIHILYNMADYLLQGTSDNLNDLQRALQYYEKVTNMDNDNTDLFGATTMEQKKDIIEYCYLISGIIYSAGSDKQKAIENLLKAKTIARTFDSDFYESLIADIN